MIDRVSKSASENNDYTAEQLNPATRARRVGAKMWAKETEQRHT